MQRISSFLGALVFLLSFMGGLKAEQPNFPPVMPNPNFSFPSDHGAHPEFRTEWWYVTGTVETDDQRKLGFQVTFFRSRMPTNQNNESAFAPKQIIFAHAALSDPKLGKLLHDQRSARAGFGIAEARVGQAAVTIKDWVFNTGPTNSFTAKIASKDFSLDLTFTPSQPVLLQGKNGYSQKGPSPEDASFYYSIPQLITVGKITQNGVALNVKGKAWFDHEWSSNYLNTEAVGWDWTGLNFENGSVLMAFRMRRSDGTALWAGGTFRQADGTATPLGPEDISFQTLESWTSPRTGAIYPVKQRLKINLPEGAKEFELTPAFPDQELDGRASALPVYWEGVVTTKDGGGYLELTGYVDPLKM